MLIRKSLTLAVVIWICVVPVLAQRGAQTGDWRTYGGDGGSTRYSVLDQINKENVKDLAVAPSMRRQGLGAALLHHAFRVFRERGAAGIELMVHSDNPSGALRLYRSLGFEAIESYKLI